MKRFTLKAAIFPAIIAIHLSVRFFTTGMITDTATDPFSFVQDINEASQIDFTLTEDIVSKEESALLLSYIPSHP